MIRKDEEQKQSTKFIYDDELDVEFESVTEWFILPVDQEEIRS